MAEMRWILKKALLLGLCLALLAGTALAAEVMDISSEGYDIMGYALTLPDGRLVFTGCHGKPGNYMDQRARILCLNPDRTVSWEYIHPAEGSWDAGSVILMKDGTLCVRLSNDPYQTNLEEKLVFFTRDGQPTGREIPLDTKETKEGYFRYGMCDFGIIKYYCTHDTEDRDKEYRELTDWDGNLLFRAEGNREIITDSIIEEEDGMVLIGNETGKNGAGKVIKLDWQGNTVWETVVPFLTDANRGAMLHCGMKTADGGYLAVLMERPLDMSSGRWKTALVKFSSTGRILWQNAESFDRQPDSLFIDLIEYDGKYVLECDDRERFASLEIPIRYMWFDADGNELGVTELSVRKDELPRLEKSKKASFYSGPLFAMGNELWGEFSSDNDSDNHEKQMASVDTVLIRIPEL